MSQPKPWLDFCPGRCADVQTQCRTKERGCSHCDIPRIDRASEGSEEFFGAGPAATFKVTLHGASCGEGLPVVPVVHPSDSLLAASKSDILAGEFIQVAVFRGRRVDRSGTATGPTLARG